MPQIPRYHTQISPTSVSMPRAPLDMEGLSPATRLGVVLSDFGQKMDKARESSQYAEAQTAWEEGIFDFENSLDGDTDYETYEKRFNLYTQKLHKDVATQISHRGALNTFEFYVNKSLPQEKAKVRHRANQLEIDFMEAKYFRQLISAVKREDRAFIVNETQNAIEAGYIKPIVGDKARDAALEKLDWTSAWNNIVNVRDRKEVRAILGESKLSSDRQISLFRNWEHEETARQAKAKEEQKIKEEEVRAAILPRLRDGTITAPEIEAVALSTEEKYKWQERLYRRNQQVAAGKDNPFSVLDPALDAQIMEAVYSDMPITEQEIRGYVGVGLTVARAEHWIARLDKPDKGYKRALEYLQSQIMPRQALTVGESSPNAASYWQAVMALDKYLETDEGQKLSGNEILKRAVETAPDYVLSMDEQIEAAKKIWTKGKEIPELKRGWWEATKDWAFGDNKEKMPEIEMPKPEIEQKMTDEEIGDFLTENGFISNSETIAKYRENNDT